jgi:hypothetical protein
MRVVFIGTMQFSRDAPRRLAGSLEAVRALATARGAASGFLAAEAFQLLRERT